MRQRQRRDRDRLSVTWHPAVLVVMVVTQATRLMATAQISIHVMKISARVTSGTVLQEQTVQHTTHRSASSDGCADG